MAIGFVIAAAVIAGLQYLDNYGPQIITDNYMFYAVLVGAVMGDPKTALIVGASIQLMSLGVAAIGGSSVPNYGMAAVVATALTIHTGQDMSVGIAVGIAAGALGVQMDVIAKILNGFVVRKAQKYCMENKFKKMERILYLGPVLFFLSAALPTLIILAFGENVTDFIVNSMPKWFNNSMWNVTCYWYWNVTYIYAYEEIHRLCSNWLCAGCIYEFECIACGYCRCSSSIRVLQETGCFDN